MSTEYKFVICALIAGLVGASTVKADSFAIVSDRADEFSALKAEDLGSGLLLSRCSKDGSGCRPIFEPGILVPASVLQSAFEKYRKIQETKCNIVKFVCYPGGVLAGSVAGAAVSGYAAATAGRVGVAIAAAFLGVTWACRVGVVENLYPACKEAEGNRRQIRGYIDSLIARIKAEMRDQVSGKRFSQ